MSPAPAPSLDVEDDDARIARLQNLFQRADSTSSSASQPPRTTPASFDFGNRETHAVQPPTELLTRLAAFLPQMEAANAELIRRAQDDPASVDIEHIDDAADGQYIEMDLGLGVFDVRRTRASPEHHSDATDESDASSSPAGSQSHSKESSPEPDIISSILPSRPARPIPRRSKPNIVVVSDTPAPDDNPISNN